MADTEAVRRRAIGARVLAGPPRFIEGQPCSCNPAHRTHHSSQPYLLLTDREAATAAEREVRVCTVLHVNYLQLTLDSPCACFTAVAGVRPSQPKLAPCHSPYTDACHSRRTGHSTGRVSTVGGRRCYRPLPGPPSLTHRCFAPKLRTHVHAQVASLILMWAVETRSHPPHSGPRPSCGSCQRCTRSWRRRRVSSAQRPRSWRPLRPPSCGSTAMSLLVHRWMGLGLLWQAARPRSVWIGSSLRSAGNWHTHKLLETSILPRSQALCEDRGAALEAAQSRVEMLEDKVGTLIHSHAANVPCVALLTCLRKRDTRCTPGRAPFLNPSLPLTPSLTLLPLRCAC